LNKVKYMGFILEIIKWFNFVEYQLIPT
jgi:hypothetical protein